MSTIASLDSLQVRTRELRPELDLALMQSYELARVYVLQEARAHVGASDRVADQRATAVDRLAAPDRMRATDATGTVRPSERVGVTAAPRLAPPREAAHCTTMIEKSVDPHPEGLARIMMETSCATDEAIPATVPLPYGPDADRIRQLVEWVVSGREIVPFATYFRQAGDLLPVDPRAAAPYVAARQVTAVYKAF